MTLRMHKEMAEVHQSLCESHAKEAESHAARAEFHKNSATNFAALQDCVNKLQGADVAEHLSAQAAGHTEMHQHHTEMAKFHQEKSDHHAEKCEECTKAAGSSSLEKSGDGDGDLNMLTQLIDSRVKKAVGDQLLPSPISVVAPERPGSRLIPRVGQELSQAQRAVPLEFSKLVAVDEDGA